MGQKVDPLDSPKYRLDHAKRHARTVAREFDVFMKEEPYALITEENSERREKTFKLKLTKPLPKSIAGFTDDAFANLRSALDQIGFAVAKAAGGRGKKCSFPFGNSEIEAKSRITGNSKELPRAMFDLMVSFQPYAGGDDLLWSLNEICNTGKHRIVSPVFFLLDGFWMKNVTLRGGGTASVGGMWDSSKNELVIATLGYGSTLSVDEFRFSSFVALDDSIEFVGGQPALEVFDALARKVEGILMAVEAEGRRSALFT